MKEIIKIGLRERRGTIVAWSLALTAYIALNMASYPTLRSQADQINQVAAQLPAAAKMFVSASGDFVSPEGFLSSKLLHLILPLLFSILAISLGSSLLAREEKSGTLELLLARPLSRTKILLAKASVGLIVLAVVTTVAIAASIALGTIVNLGVAPGALGLSIAMTAIFGALFGSLAFMLTALGKHTRTLSTGLASLFALAGYLIVSLDGLLDWLKWPAYLFPYHYYQPERILDGSFSWLNIAGFIFASILLIVLAAFGFRHRDIES